MHGTRAASLLLRVDEPAGPAPAGLRPELVPSVEIVKVLPTVSNPAVLELEDDAVANIQVLAVDSSRAIYSGWGTTVAARHSRIASESTSPRGGQSLRSSA